MRAWTISWFLKHGIFQAIARSSYQPFGYEGPKQVRKASITRPSPEESDFATLSALVSTEVHSVLSWAARGADIQRASFRRVHSRAHWLNLAAANRQAAITG